MPRKLQHIALTDDVKAALRDGRKVTSFCGSRNYPMTQMGDEIPTCTPCATKSREMYESYIDSRAGVTYTYSSAAPGMHRWTFSNLGVGGVA